MLQKFILGLKGETSQVFNADGVRIPATRIKVPECYIVDIKSQDKDGYFAVKLAMGPTKRNKKSEKGILDKAGVKNPLRFFKEIRLNRGKNAEESEMVEGSTMTIKVGKNDMKLGDKIVPSEIFASGDIVTVTGTSKGKGFQGVVKRHNFAGGPRTRGQSDRERAPGSIGSGTTPGRVYKGKRMAGRMGSDTVTIKNLLVVGAEDDALIVKGVVPGVKEGLLIIKSQNDIPEKVVEEVIENAAEEVEEVATVEVVAEAEAEVVAEATEEKAEEAPDAEEVVENVAEVKEEVAAEEEAAK